MGNRRRFNSGPERDFRASSLVYLTLLLFSCYIVSMKGLTGIANLKFYGGSTWRFSMGPVMDVCCDQTSFSFTALGKLRATLADRELTEVSQKTTSFCISQRKYSTKEKLSQLWPQTHQQAYILILPPPPLSSSLFFASAFLSSPPLSVSLHNLYSCTR